MIEVWCRSGLFCEFWITDHESIVFAGLSSGACLVSQV